MATSNKCYDLFTMNRTINIFITNIFNPKKPINSKEPDHQCLAFLAKEPVSNDWLNDLY